MKSFNFLAIFVFVIQSTVAVEPVEEPLIPKVTIPDQFKVEKKWTTLDGDEVTGSLLDANYKMAQLTVVQRRLFVDGKNFDKMSDKTQQFVLNYTGYKDRKAAILDISAETVPWHGYTYFAIGIQEISGNVRVVPAAMLVLLDEESAAMESLQKSVDDRIAALIGKEELTYALATDKTTERAMDRVIIAGVLSDRAL